MAKAESESAVAGQDEHLPAVRARALRLPEGGGDAGGTGRGVDARRLAAGGGSHPVRPVPHVTGRPEALGGGGLGRQDGGQAAEVGPVGAVGVVYSTEAVDRFCGGKEWRGGEEEEEREEGRGVLHGG